MNTTPPETMVVTHQQIHPDSCAASGMEMVAKCHGSLAPDATPLQTKYGDQNIGFEKLFELKAYGIEAESLSISKADFEAKVGAEIRAGRFPLVSVRFPGQPKYHIWICSLGKAGTIEFHSRAYGDAQPQRRTDVASLPPDIHCVFYRLDAENQKAQPARPDNGG